VPPVLALAMGVMMLDVVVGPPCLVSLLNLRPGARIGEGMVGEPSLYIRYLELPLMVK
jgi:hypothetical protein